MQSTQATVRRRDPLATTALVLAVIAAVASLTSSVIVGLGLGQVQARAVAGEQRPGDASAETPYFWLLASQAIWTVLGIAGLVLGVIARRRGIARHRAVTAIIVAVVTPFLSAAVWFTLTLLTSPLG